MKAKGTKPRPSVIVAELGAKGIKVATAQVSIVLKKMGFRPLNKRRKKGAAEVGRRLAPRRRHKVRPPRCRSTTCWPAGLGSVLALLGGVIGLVERRRPSAA